MLMTDQFEDLRYTDCAPPAEILEQFQTRRDNQIASLEMLAIAYGSIKLPLKHAFKACAVLA